MNKKQLVLLLSTLIFVPLSLYQIAAPQGFCDSNSIFLCSYPMYQIVTIKNLFGLVFFFSLLTYKLPESVFVAWWKFARVAIPTVLSLVALINLGLHHSPGGFFNIDYAIDRAAVGIIYTIFTIGSLIQIYRGWRKR